jgi:hypothetical protein
MLRKLQKPEKAIQLQHPSSRHCHLRHPQTSRRASPKTIELGTDKTQQLIKQQ